MRTLPRKRLALIAAVDPLEGRNAISSLMIGVFGANEGDQSGTSEIARPDIGQGLGEKRPTGMSRPANRAFVPILVTPPTAKASLSQEKRAVPVTRSAATATVAATVALGGIAPLIGEASGSIDAPAVPCPRPPSQPVGVGGRSNGASISQAAVVPAKTPAPRSGEIRPLAMAPPAPQPFVAPIPSPATPDGGDFTSRGGSLSWAGPVASSVSGGTGPVANSVSGGTGPVLTSINYFGSNAISSSGGTYYDIIGSRASISVPDPDGWFVTNVDWSFSGSARVQYSSQKPLSTSDNGFVNYQVMPYQMGRTQTFYWGASGGLETITANVTYVNYINGFPNYGTGSKSIQVDVKFPDSAVALTPGPAPDKTNEQPPEFSYGNQAAPGMSWTSSVVSELNDANKKLVPYDYGIVQTITSGDMIRSQTGQPREQRGLVDISTTPYTSPRPLVDCAQSFMPWYNGLATGLSANATDSPSQPLDANYDTARMNLSFLDTLMYMPQGGIWVPLGNFTWRVDSTLKLTGGVWNINAMATVAPSQRAYAGFTPSWPFWVGRVSDLGPGFKQTVA